MDGGPLCDEAVRHPCFPCRDTLGSRVILVFRRVFLFFCSSYPSISSKLDEAVLLLIREKAGLKEPKGTLDLQAAQVEG